MHLSSPHHLLNSQSAPALLPVASDEADGTQGTNLGEAENIIEQLSDRTDT